MKTKEQKRGRYYLSRAVSALAIIVLFLTIPYFVFPPGSVFAADNSAIVICINPGHGGRDYGATGPSGLKEKDVNLDIAFRLREKLSGAGFKVILVREDDTKKSLDEIVDFVNASNADIFISIHNNSHTNSEKNGTAQVSDVVIIIGRDLLASAGFNNSTGNAGAITDLIVANILNGQGTHGIAARTKSSIEAAFIKSGASINVEETKNADSFNYKKTKILIFTDSKGVKDTARQLQDFLGAGEIVKSGSITDNVDITIILGSDYK